jgi:metalloendopeptidase OMA1, mitochondrial
MIIAGTTRNAARLLVVLGICLGGAAVPGCSGAGSSDGGPGHRAQALALTPEQEHSLGEQAYREVLSKARVVRRGPEVERVHDVGQRIAKAAENQPLQREINLHVEGYHFAWEFNVIENDQVNAFCLPGGKVAVFTGLLRVAEKDDGLATVMSHEIAHALAHHASERIARQQKLERAAEAASGILGTINPGERKELIGLLAAGAQFGSLPFDRKQESEADHIGLFLMTFAGFDPNQAVVFWERMQEVSQRHGKVPEILSDHPSDARRIAQIKEWAPQAVAARKAFEEGRIAPGAGRSKR